MTEHEWTDSDGGHDDGEDVRHVQPYQADEDLPLPGLRPRDPSRRGARGRGAASAPQGPAALAHRLLAVRAAAPDRPRSGAERSAASERGFEHVDDPAAARRPGAPTRRRSADPRPAPGASASQRRASNRSRCCLRTVTASTGEPERVAAPGLHLAEHDERRPARDQVDLAFADAASSGRRPRSRARRTTSATASSPAAPVGAARVGHQCQSSLPGSSSTLTSLKVTTCTSATNRVWRYMSHTHASRSCSSK